MPVTNIRGQQILNNTVQYVDIQQVAANRLVGNPTGSAATMSEISLGTGLSFSGGSVALSANLQSLSGLSYSSAAFVKMTAAGTFALDTATYLTSETDTLSSVTGRGATTATAISLTNSTATSSASTGALIVTGGVGVGGSVWIGTNLTTGGLTMGQGITNQNIYLNIQNPGIGYGNGFNFVRGTDGAGIRVIETGSDNTMYEMWMSDNPDGGDMMQWRFDDWQNANGLTVPIHTTGKTNRYVAETHYIYGTLYQSTAGFFTTANTSGINGSDKQLVFNTVSKLRVVGSTVDLTGFNVSGYNSTDGNLFWIKLDSTTTFSWGYGSPAGAATVSGIALSTSETTLSNGIKVTFSAATGTVGDTFAARIFKAPSNTFGITTATSFIKSGGTSAQFLMADGSVSTNPGWITGNQSITLSGDVGGSGTTTIATTLATITQSSGANFVKITLDTKGRVTGNTAVGSGDITTALGYTPYNATNPSGYTSNTGTVTSVAALTLGTTGTDLSSSVATGTTTPVITLNVPTASASNRGVLSSTDWSTFNGKQAALNGTGFVKATGTTISYDNSTYALSSHTHSYFIGTTAVQTSSANQALTGITGITFAAEASDAASITTTISSTSTFFDFNLADDNNNDEWRWRFTPSGGSVYNAMRLVPVSNTAANLTVSGTITSSNFSGSSSGTNTGDQTLSGLGGQPQLNGTGFVKASGTTISYDNSTYYLASNPSGYTTNTGTVTSVSGTGTVSGLTLTGTVTGSGSLMLGGTLSLTSGNVTTALGYTPYNSTNPSGYITAAQTYYIGTTQNALNRASAAQTLTGVSIDGNADTVDSLHAIDFGRAYSSGYSFGGTNVSMSTADFISILTSIGAFSQPYWVARGSWCYACNKYITDTGLGDIHLAGCTVEVIGDATNFTIRIHTPTTSNNGVTNTEFIYVQNSTGYSPGWRKIWNSATLTNLNQLTNGPGYITSYTETDTLASVTARGASTSTAVTFSGNVKIGAGLSDSAYTRITYPAGGSYVTTTSVITGAIRILLPTQGSAMMMTCTVKVYEYNTNKSFTITFGGHRDSANWYNEFCYLDGGENRGELTVRFGVDNGKDCVWIGETNTSWSYPQVFVTDVQLGYTGYSATWLSGWSVDFVTAFTTVNRTQTAYRKLTPANYNSYAPTLTGTGASGTWGISISGNADTVDGYHASVGNNASYAVVRDASGDIFFRYSFSSYVNTTDDVNSGSITNIIAKFGDNYHRSASAASVQTFLGLGSMAYASSAAYLLLAGGTMSGKIFTVSTGTGTYDTAIEIRETGYANTAQSAWGYSPAMTFHWGGRYAKRFGMRSDGLFAVDDEPLALRSWVTSQGYITGYSETDTLATVTSRGAGTTGGITVNGTLTVGNTTASYIYMIDTDENSRYIHCNSGRIGFLNSSSSWGAYCDNSGNWISDFSVRAPVFYDSANTDYYLEGATNSAWRIGTANGYLDIGPMNSSYCHFQTDRGTFYFNTRVEVNGELWRYNGSRFVENTGTWGINVTGTAAYLPTYYAGGQQLNPQTYFAQSVGLRVAMTAAWSVWSDTLWINGYSGGDVLQMCALHTMRDGTPRIAISAQASNATTYGTIYQFLTEYNWTSYAPTKTGGGASGTWGISITGDAGSVDGIDSSRIVYGDGARGRSVDKSNANANTSDSSNPSGFYFGNTTTGMPTTDWWNWINVAGNSWSGGDGYGFQLANSFWGDDLKFRRLQSGTWYSWIQILTSGNISSYAITSLAGETLQQVMTRGASSSTYMTLTGGGTFNSGSYYFKSNKGSGVYISGTDSPPLQVFSDDGGAAFMSFHRGGSYAVNMGLDPDNVMRIGGWSASSNRWQLDMSGNMTVAGDVTAYSDARVKTNIKTVEKALEKTLQLRGVTYTRTDSDDKKTKLGVIAQEILEVIPEVVNQDNDGMYNVSYGNLAGVFIEAIKEQQAQIEDLKKQIQYLVENR